MKQVIIIISILFSSLLHSQKVYQNENKITLYVWAKNGLVLRKSPNLKSDKILSISYGKKVEIIDTAANLTNISYHPPYWGDIRDTLFTYKYNEKSNHAILYGEYVKVKYGNHYGFVFSAYLFKSPTFTIKQIQKGLSSKTPQILIDLFDIDHELIFIDTARVGGQYEWGYNNKFVYNDGFQIRQYYDGGVCTSASIFIPHKKDLKGRAIISKSLILLKDFNTKSIKKIKEGDLHDNSQYQGSNLSSYSISFEGSYYGLTLDMSFYGITITVDGCGC